jgi:hypothetical protein
MESQVLQTTPRLFTSAAFLCVALSLIVTAPAFAQVSECKNEPEKANAAPLGAKDLIQLQPNAARPTLDIALADKSGGTDKISFLPKAGRRVGVGTRVAAELTDAPRTGSAPLGGDIFVRANGTATARGVWRSQSAWRIFQDSRPAVYLGTITIYGPDFADFNYALAITTKWPWWSAVTIIGVVLVAFAAIALISDFWLREEEDDLELRRRPRDRDQYRSCPWCAYLFHDLQQERYLGRRPWHADHGAGHSKLHSSDRRLPRRT